MDTITNHHSLASILTSLVESRRKGEELSITSHVAQKLSSSQDEGEKAILADMLVALLSKSQDIYAENVLSNFVKSLVASAVENSEEITHQNLQLCGKIALLVPAILSEFVQETQKIISSLLLAASNSHVTSDDAFEVNLQLFLEKYCSFTFKKGQRPEVSDFFQPLYTTVIQHLKFLKIVLLMEINTAGSAKVVYSMKPLLPLLLPLIALRNMKVADLSCHVFRLLLGKLDVDLSQGTSEMIWCGIKPFLEVPTHADLAFSIWLRWVSLSGMNSRPLESMLEHESYWSSLQSGLSTGFNERRKSCLYILNSSLQLVSKPIYNTLLQYDSSSSKDSAAWAKYSTMIEIISLSTSTNQFLAAVPDIRSLLKPSSSICGSWIVVLMTLGLTSSCGPLQKAVWEFMLSLSGIELGKLLEAERGGSFINDVFLPYSIVAHHFSTHMGKNFRCEYGDKLAGFLKKAIIQSRDVASLLKFVDIRQDKIFAPARVYVLKGIMDGAVELPGNDFGLEEMAMIVRISKMKRFALLKTDLCISMCFKLLLLINLDRTAFEPFFDALAETFSGKEHLITISFVRSLRGFFADCKSVNMNPSFLLMRFEDTLKACNREDAPSRTLLQAAILIALLNDKGEMLVKALNSISLDKSQFRFLSVLFSIKELAEEILQDPEARITMITKLENTINNFPKNSLKHGYTTELASLLYYQRAFRFLNHLDNKTLMALFKNAWDLVRTQDSAQTRMAHLGQQKEAHKGFNLETGIAVSELLAICDASGFALVEKTGHMTFAGKDEVLGLIVGVSFPALDQNKHENEVRLRTIGKFIYFAYGLLNSSIVRSSEQELNVKFVKSLFDTARQMLRYTDKGSLLKILECFRTVFRSAPTFVDSYPELDSLVHDLWGCIGVTRAVAEESLLEVSLIKTIFDISVIRASLVTKALVEILLEIGKEIMKLSKGKRSLAPAFAWKLREAYLNDPEIFCSCKWITDIFIEFINCIPGKDPEFLVENSVARIFDEVCSKPYHYEKYYEEKEEMAQVYIFDILSRLDPSNSSESAFANCLRDKIYDPWTLNKPGMPVYSKWKRVSQLQALLVLGRFVTAERSAPFLATIIPTLCNEPHPRYRFFFEWIAALCITRFSENRNCIWKYLQAPDDPNPKLQASLLRVAIMVARELQENLKEEFYTELLYTVIPLSSNNKVVVRHQATSMILELWDDLAKWEHLRNNEIFQRLRQSILNSGFFKQIATAGKMENEKTFDVRSNYTFAGILSGNYLLGGDEADLISPELFALLEAQDLKKSFIAIGSADTLEGSKKVEFTKTEEAALVEAPLQTKSGSWDAKALIEANDHRRSKASFSKDAGLEIIVIASLIENAYNLGGLSRVSEIMGVNTLCFNSKDVLKVKDFTSVSVSSEVWLPILELKAKDVLEYIRAKKFEGYSAVGIEQTDRSVNLGSDGYGLPKKVVLLLGSEKYGIPAELLVELDLCVEIPQKGETRSMNVQTAAAVVLYEFCRQLG